MPALDPYVRRKLREFLLGEFRRRPNAVAKRISVNSQCINHNLSFVLFGCGGGLFNASYLILGRQSC